MKFRKYQHICRYNEDEVENIEIGKCYIFYKIDGTNSSVWLDDDGNIACGSRNRTLSLENDNAGFMEYILKQDNIKKYLDKHPTHRLFGEWLVPHSLKTYRDNAWRNFYVFDVTLDKDEDQLEYIPYETYKPLLEEFNINYVPPLAIATNPNYETLIRCLEKTGQFLVEDGAGKGEGIVIKNYDFYNKYGRQTWGKIVCNEFKEASHKEMGAPTIGTGLMIEEKIIDKYVTEALVEKEYEKIRNEKGWKSQYIPELFGKVWYCLITEEGWHMIKEFNNPKIDFSILHIIMIRKIKEIKSELFS